MFNFINKRNKFTTPKCSLCTLQPAMTDFPICEACVDDFPFTLESFINADIDPNCTEVSAVCHYAHPISEMIVAYKYHHDLTLLNTLAHLYLALPEPTPNTLLVPMPSSNTRLKTRGFDHIYLLTKQLSIQWHLPIWQGVKRMGVAKTQKGLNRTQRLQNMTGQFKLTTLPPVGHKLLIIDDVCTTGSTIAALATCLAETKLSSSAYVLAHQLN